MKWLNLIRQASPKYTGYMLGIGTYAYGLLHGYGEAKVEPPKPHVRPKEIEKSKITNKLIVHAASEEIALLAANTIEKNPTQNHESTHLLSHPFITLALLRNLNTDFNHLFSEATSKSIQKQAKTLGNHTKRKMLKQPLLRMLYENWNKIPPPVKKFGLVSLSLLAIREHSKHLKSHVIDLSKVIANVIPENLDSVDEDFFHSPINPTLW